MSLQGHGMSLTWRARPISRVDIAASLTHRRGLGPGAAGAASGFLPTSHAALL